MPTTAQTTHSGIARLTRTQRDMAKAQQALIDSIAAGDHLSSQSAVAELRLVLRAPDLDPIQAQAARDALEAMAAALRHPYGRYAEKPRHAA